MEIFTNPITYGVLGYLLKSFLGSVASMSRAILSIRYCAQYVIDASQGCSDARRTEEIQTAWKELVSDDAMRNASMKVLSYPAGCTSAALWIQREWLGLENENPATASEIRAFAKYVVRAGGHHAKGTRTPNSEMQEHCKRVAFYCKASTQPIPQPRFASKAAAA